MSMESNLTNQDGLYIKQYVDQKICIPFQQLQPNIEEQFIHYAKKHIMNKCSKEGYISNHAFQVVSYSAGKTNSHHVEYNVVFEFHVCHPYEGMILRCKIQSVTKIGIKGILSHDDKENPIVVFASHLHNPSIFDDVESSNNDDTEIPSASGFTEGQIIQIKVIGHRFEINDPSIYVLAEIIN